MALLLALVTVTVEASVGDNWAAVAEAIRGRIADLGITQKELVTRSGVSESTIRQLQNNYGPRKRSRHTLEDLSRGLEWPAHYLARVLGESTASAPPSTGDSLQAEVAELRSRVIDLANRVEALEHGTRSR
jgi:transcriptional regulator with XRE-family HTH domain